MDKKILLLVFCGILLVICSYSVSAAIGSVNMSNPINNSNFTTSIWFNITYSNGTGVTDAVNATIYYNASGGTVLGAITSCSNDTDASGNCTGWLSVASLDDGIYTFNATVDNSTGASIWTNISAFMVTIDNTPPNVSAFYNTVDGGRYNSTLVVNVSVSDNLIGLDEVYFNLTNTTYGVWRNSSSVDRVYFNYTWDIMNLTDGTWTLTVYANDSYVNNTNSSESISFTIDNNQTPTVTNFVNTVDYGNYTTGNKVLNVSVVDSEVSSVYFNVANWANGTQVNWTKAGISATGSNYYNMTLDITNYADGLYNVTVYANDTLNNLNYTESIRFRVDQTGPSVSVSRSAYTRTSITLAVTVSDDSNVTGTCTSSRTGATVTRTDGANQVVTETGLSCSTSYTYTVTCTDIGGYSGSSVSYSTSTDACAGGSSVGGGGGGTTTTWTHTYTVNDVQFEAGYTKEIGTKERMTVKVGTKTHTVGVVSLTATTANIEVSSSPVMITLGIGGEAKLDLDDDGFYDIQIWLLGIANNKADIKVLKINQEVPEGGESVSTTGEVTPIGGEEEEAVVGGEEEGKINWLWIVIGALVIIAAFVVAGIMAKKKKK